MPSEFINNENRARLRDSINKPAPRSADGSIAGGARIDPTNSVPGVEMGPGILGAPMTKDAHANARHSNENRTAVPAEKSREKYAAEITRRLHDPARSTKYR